MDHGLSGRGAALARAAGLAALYLGLAAALAVATTWPAALRLVGHSYPQLVHPDLQCGLWWSAALGRWLTGEGDLFWRPDLLWPDGQDTRFLLWNFAGQLTLSPIHAWLSPLVATNIAALACLVLNGLAAAWAGRAVTGTHLGALAGLLVGATGVYTFAEGASGRVDQALWAPAAVFFGGLVLLWRDPGRWRPRIICGVGLGLAGAVYWFYAYFLVVLLVLAAAVALARRRLPLARVKDLVAVGLISGAVALPFLLPLVLKLAEGGAMIRMAVDQQGDTFLHQSRFAVPALWGYLGALGPTPPVPGTRLPLLALPLCLAAIWRGRGAVRWAGIMGALAAIFAAGPLLVGSDGQPYTVGQHSLLGPMAALDALPGFARFWWPYRWQGVLLAATAVTVPWLLSRLPWQRAALAVLAAWLVFEGAVLVRPGGDAPLMRAAPVPGILDQMARLGGPARPVLNLPFNVPGGSTMGFAAWHRQPIDGGLGPWFHGHAGHQRRRQRVLLWRTMERALRGEPVRAPARWTAAQSGGFHYVILHSYAFPEQEVPRQVDRVNAVLGPPAERTKLMTVWAVPGVVTKK